MIYFGKKNRTDNYTHVTFILTGNNSLELMIKQKQQARAQAMDSFIDDLAAKYGGDKKTKTTKRKAAPKAEPPTKNKRRK